MGPGWGGDACKRIRNEAIGESQGQKYTWIKNDIKYTTALDNTSDLLKETCTLETICQCTPHK